MKNKREKLRILLTGYGIWSYEKDSPANPSQLVAESLHADTLDCPDLVAPIESFIVPVDYETCIDKTVEKILDYNPDIVVSMGEYPGRAVISVERIAQNHVDGRRYGLTDETGRVPHGAIKADGAPAYYASIPVHSMVRRMRDNGVPSDVSDTAGLFLCNVLFYGVLHYLNNAGLEQVEAGWIHLPSLPETAALDQHIGMPSMALETQLKGVREALKAAVKMYGRAGDDEVVVQGPLQI